MSVLLMLCCDHDVGELCRATERSAHRTPADIRRWAARQGWTHHGDLDFCARHNTDAKPRPRVTPFDSDPHD